MVLGYTDRAHNYKCLNANTHIPKEMESTCGLIGKAVQNLKRNWVNVISQK